MDWERRPGPGFAKGEKMQEAHDAGADFVGRGSFKKIQEGWLDFERVVATPDMMSVVGRLENLDHGA